MEKDSFFLLGYELKLSPTERKLLRAITEGGKSSVEHLTALLPEGVNPSNVAVHISSINKKAEMLSKRKLVIYENYRYRINPFM